MIGFLLLLFLALGLLWIVLLQADIIKQCYLRNKIFLNTRPLSLKVIERLVLSDQHFSIRLQAVNGVQLTGFQPGQYLTLMANTQSGQSRIHKRCYSLAAWHEKPCFYELCIKREKQGQVSEWLHRNFEPGSVIDVLPPAGNFVFDLKPSQHAVLIAGGIGITPLRAMVQKFIKQGANKASSIRSLNLFYAAKTVDQMCYLDEFSRLADEFPEFHFFPIISQAEQSWRGLTGRLDADRLIQYLDDKITYHYYICGPQTMMDNVKLGLLQQGILSEAIHFERFGIGISPESDREFVINLGSDKTITFQKHQSLLEALEQEGIEIESDCRSGGCGQCKVKLYRGKIKQLIEPDMNLAEGEILACSCVPESDLHIGI